MDKTCSDATHLYISDECAQHAHVGGPKYVRSMRIVAERLGPCHRRVVVGPARPLLPLTESISLPEQASVVME